jgi:hypothetical protein
LSREAMGKPGLGALWAISSQFQGTRGFHSSWIFLGSIRGKSNIPAFWSSTWQCWAGVMQWLRDWVLESNRPRFKSSLYHFLFEGPWNSYVAFPSLSSSPIKGIILAPSSLSIVRCIWWCR